MAVQSSGDPVPSVSEAEATGDIAELFAECRTTLGMSFVNLIWRNLASIPDGLRWTWETIRPLYNHGAIYHEAQALRDSQVLPPHVAEMVRTVNLIGARGDAQNIQVSLPRSLARWPGFLTIYYTALKPLHDNGSLLTAIDAVMEDGMRRGRAISAALGATDPPAAATAAAVRASLESLVPNAMGRMIPIVSLLLRLMPIDTDGTPKKSPSREG